VIYYKYGRSEIAFTVNRPEEFESTSTRMATRPRDRNPWRRRSLPRWKNLSSPRRGTRGFTGTDNIDPILKGPQLQSGLDTGLTSANEKRSKKHNSVSGKYVRATWTVLQRFHENGSGDEPNTATWVSQQCWNRDCWAPYSNGYWNYVGPWGLGLGLATSRVGLCPPYN